jgi:hypothetical protein
LVDGDIEEDDLLLFVAAVAEDSLAAAAAPPPAPGANNIPNGALYGCWVRSIVTIPPSPLLLRNDDADNILKKILEMICDLGRGRQELRLARRCSTGSVYAVMVGHDIVVC